MGVGLGFGFGPLRFFIPLSPRRRRNRRRAAYWTRPGCSVHHRTQAAAQSCPNGRRAAPQPAQSQIPAPRHDYVPRLVAVPPKDDADALIASAELVIAMQYASEVMLQRKLGISPLKSAEALALLEQCRIVGPANGSGQRNVLLSAAQLPQGIQLLRTLPGPSPQLPAAAQGEQGA